MTPYPAALYKDDVMRTAQNKSNLKIFLVEGVKPSENRESEIAADGGALLWLCNWKKGEKFSKIFDMYIDKCRQKFNINTDVFHGYNKSTKDATHKEGSNKMSEVVEISDGNTFHSDRAKFLTNYTNKQKFVNLLACKLKLHGFIAVLCPSYADRTLVKTCLQFKDKTVTVLADDTDILCLLLHHMYYTNNKNETYLKNMTIQSNKDERVNYNINDIISSTKKEYLEHLLFCHAFTGCDTTSQIHNFRKKSIFSKFKMLKDIQHLSEQFYEASTTVNEIGNASIRVFKLLYSTTFNLQQIRKQKYDTMAASDCSKMDPAILPPSTRAAFFHGLRVDHQIVVWKDLSDVEVTLRLQPLR